MESLPIVESFYTIQGEGAHTGRAAYFIRLSGCDVGCSWCDAKESWAKGRHEWRTVESIVREVVESGAETVVITGGEPLMHNLSELTHALHEVRCEIFMESSGSHPMSGEIDWVCLSPKRKKAPLDELYTLADELKVVICTAEDLQWAEQCRERVEKRGAAKSCQLFLQPEWSARELVTPLIVEYVKQNPEWRVSLQTHKYMNIP